MTRRRGRSRRGGRCSSSIAATLFERALTADPDARLEDTVEHPFFGPLNWRETLLFIRLHDLDHAGQLAEDRRRAGARALRLMRVAIGAAAGIQRRLGGGARLRRARPSGWAWTASGRAEAWGHDAVTPLAFMAARTSRIRLGSGIMQAGTRTPALLAMTAMSLASMSGGRFLLGLGVSGPQVIEGWHGIRFDRPVRACARSSRSSVAACGASASTYKGQVYELPLPGGEGKALRSAAARAPDIPIYLATLSPRSLEMTGEIADGWLGTSFMPEHARVFFDSHRGGREAGRPRAGAARPAGRRRTWPSATTSSGCSPPRKPGLAFTLGAMGSRQHNFYNDAFKRAGYTDAAVEVQRLWLDGKREEAAARVPDEMAIKANLLGTEAMVRERVAHLSPRRHHHAPRRSRRRQPGGPAGHPGPADGDRESGLRSASTDLVTRSRGGRWAPSRQMLPPWGAAFVGRRRLASAAPLRV